MNDKSTEERDGPEKINALIVRALEGRGKKARFITELSAALKRSAIAADELERALVELETAGQVMIRDHFCADPHLSGVDLRIAALVSESAGADAGMNAIRAIDEAWDRWLTEYLANHRCE